MAGVLDRQNFPRNDGKAVHIGLRERGSVAPPSKGDYLGNYQMRHKCALLFIASGMHTDFAGGNRMWMTLVRSGCLLVALLASDDLGSLGVERPS